MAIKRQITPTLLKKKEFDGEIKDIKASKSQEAQVADQRINRGTPVES